VVAVGGHDTASAVASIPARSSDFAFISSGTWSLVGLELEAPVLSEASRAADFTNELGIDGTVRYLKNVMGLWVLSESIRAWRAANSVPDHDLRPTGPPAHTTAGLRWQHRLDSRLAETDLPDISEWWNQLAPIAPHIASDPQIRVLASHLNQMAIDGVDVQATLTDAINDGPLPAEHTFGALAYRLERHRDKHTTETIPEGWPAIPTTLPRRPQHEHHSPSHHLIWGVSVSSGRGEAPPGWVPGDASVVALARGCGTVRGSWSTLVSV